MKNFEESLRQLNAPDPRVAAFRQRLRHDLVLAGRDLSLRRWRGACLASGGLAVALMAALAGFVAAPGVPAMLHARVAGPSAAVDAEPPVRLAEREISAESDRAFIEAYYARLGNGVRIRSVDDERLVAIREFTMSDGQKMLVYTELGEDSEGDDDHGGESPTDVPTMLASRPRTTF